MPSTISFPVVRWITRWRNSPESRPYATRWWLGIGRRLKDSKEPEPWTWSMKVNRVYVLDMCVSEDQWRYNDVKWYKMIESKLLMTETLVIRYNYCRIYMYRPDAIRLSWQPKKNVDFVNGGGVETPPKNDHSKWPPFFDPIDGRRWSVWSDSFDPDGGRWRVVGETLEATQDCW